MTADDQEQEEELAEVESAIDTRRRREMLWREKGERSLGQNLALMGSFGWLMVTPILIGVFIGRRLDERFQTGVMWTAALVFIGVLFGGFLVWDRIRDEPE